VLQSESFWQKVIVSSAFGRVMKKLHSVLNDYINGWN